MLLRTLNETSNDELYIAFQEAFKNYPRTWDRTDFENTLKRRGYVPVLSFGVFAENRLASFTINGVGIFNGLKTAYDAGTGTIPEFRAKNLATTIFKESIPILKEDGIEQYLLEVLTINTAAVSIYSNLGFQITRNFNYHVIPHEQVGFYQKPLPVGVYFAPLTLTDYERMMNLRDDFPSWQNSFDSLLRIPEVFKIVAAFEDNRLIGYGIIEPKTGDIPQLAVHPEWRRQGLGSHILKQLCALCRAENIRIVNTDASSESIQHFLKANHIPISGSQYEMILNLNDV